MADDSLTLEGRKYVSSGRAARLYGYTKDYVGQLCRSGKLDAQLIGRSWYVSEDSIRKHKLGVHYTLKNPKKTKASDTKKDESTIVIKAISDDSREMHPRHNSVSRDEEPVSVRSVEQPPQYADIPLEQDVHTNHFKEDNADLFPVPRRKSRLLDPLSRSDIRYEAYASVQDVESKSERTDTLKPHAGHTGAASSKLTYEPITSIPIRSRSRTNSRREHSVSGMRVVSAPRSARLNNRYTSERISYSSNIPTQHRRPNKPAIDGVLPSPVTPVRSRMQGGTTAAFVGDVYSEDRVVSEYGHRPLSQRYRVTSHTRVPRRSFAVPVLGALIVFAAFVLLYLLFS